MFIKWLNLVKQKQKKVKQKSAIISMRNVNLDDYTPLYGIIDYDQLDVYLKGNPDEFGVILETYDINQLNQVSQTKKWYQQLIFWK